MTDTDATVAIATPQRVVERYNYELWNEQKYDIAKDIMGAEVVRNTPGGRVVLTHDQAVQRVREFWASARDIQFTLLRIVADDELCSIVYQAEITKLDGTRDCVASLEVYRVADGRIVEVWNNSTYDHDHWPEFSGGVLS
jgi:predicted SnoaL-like aldol condensation-catalyzing enzyme